VIALLPAGLAAVSAALLAVAGYVGGWMVAAAAGLCVLALALGWGELLRVPHRSGTALLIGLLGVAGVVGGAFAVWPRTAVSEPLAVFTAVMAGAVLTSFGHELFRQDGRHDLVESITGTLAGQAVAVFAAGWVLIAFTAPGAPAIVVAAVAIAVARLGYAVPIALPPGVAAGLGIALGVGGAVLAAGFVSDVSLLTAAIIGISVSGIGIAIDRLLTPPERAEPLHGLDLSMLARAAAPVATAGTVAYAVVKLGLG
jgi:hypothetical protein